MEKGNDSISEEESDIEEENLLDMYNLISAINNNNISEIENYLKQNNLTIDKVRVHGTPLLHYAISLNRYELVKYCLQSGGSVSCVNSLHQSPLIAAAKVGNINILNLCLQYGSRVEDRDLKGMTAVHMASMYGYITILSSLLSHGAELDVRDNKGRTPLMFAAQQDKIVALKWLLNHRARILDQDSRGRSVLHWAASEGSTTVVKYILDSKYGPQLARTIDFNRQTPYDIAKEACMQAEGLHQASLQATLHLLQQYSKHRIQYELKDLFDAYFAYLLIPSLSFIGIFFFIYFNLFTSFIPSSLSFTFLILTSSVILLWFFLCSSDPGRVIDKFGYLTSISGLNRNCRQNYLDSISGKKVTRQSLCSSCEIERPNRCKHCSKCDVCIMRLDHHCRWINNCVGQKNHRIFFFFLSLCIVVVLFTYYIIYRMFKANCFFQCNSQDYSCKVLHVLFFIYCLFLAFVGSYCVYLWCLQVYQISKNITTNELLNWRNYSYLQDINHHFLNPYDQGVFWNWCSFLGITNNRGYDIVQMEMVIDLNSWTNSFIY